MVKRGTFTRIRIDLSEGLTPSELVDLQGRAEASGLSLEEYALRVLLQSGDLGVRDSRMSSLEKTPDSTQPESEVGDD